jgi:hypothetical protein
MTLKVADEPKAPLCWRRRRPDNAQGVNTLQHFVIKLQSDRENFMATMTPEEMQVMQTHAGYWRGLLDQGKAIVFGPVADPAGSYGLGVVAVEDEAELKAIEAADPAITSKIGLSYYIAPMVRAVYKS